jgi:hypothetical protein
MDEHREGIQADKPVPPWEQPGCFRLDGEPHRGDMLWWLACAGFVLGILTLVPVCGWLFGLLGIPVGLCNRHIAKGDLAKMQTGLMDSAGEEDTVLAMSLSAHGLWCSIVGMVVWGGVYLVLCWIKGSPPL